MKTCNEKMMSFFLLPHHHLRTKCTTNIYDYNFFHIGFEVIFYEYNQLPSNLRHKVIDLLIAKNKIPFSDLKFRLS